MNPKHPPWFGVLLQRLRLLSSTQERHKIPLNSCRHVWSSVCRCQQSLGWANNWSQSWAAMSDEGLDCHLKDHTQFYAHIPNCMKGPKPSSKRHWMLETNLLCAFKIAALHYWYGLCMFAHNYRASCDPVKQRHWHPNQLWPPWEVWVTCYQPIQSLIQKTSATWFRIGTLRELQSWKSTCDFVAQNLLWLVASWALGMFIAGWSGLFQQSDHSVPNIRGRGNRRRRSRLAQIHICTARYSRKVCCENLLFCHPLDKRAGTRVRLILPSLWLSSMESRLCIDHIEQLS